MTFKLRGRQPEWLAAIHTDLQTRSRLLCIAPGGVGKTTLFAALAADMWAKGIRTLVLENRDRLTEQTAERIRNETGLEVDVEKGDQRASPHAPIVVACVQSLSKPSRLTGFLDAHFGLVVADECFPSSVKVDGKSIRDIQPGDFVTTYNHDKRRMEKRRVSAKSRSLPRALVELNCNGRSIVATEGHPFFERRKGYIQCSRLREGDEVAINGIQMRRLSMPRDAILNVQSEVRGSVCCVQGRKKENAQNKAGSSMQTMRDSGGLRKIQANLPDAGRYLWEQGILQHRMPENMGQRKESTRHASKADSPQQNPCPRENEKKQPDEQSIYTSEGRGIEQGKDVFIQRREREDYHTAIEAGHGNLWVSNRASDCHSGSEGQIRVAAGSLQSGYSVAGNKTGNRGGRGESQIEEVAILGPEKDSGIEFVRVDRVKVLEPRGEHGYSEVCPDGYVYNLEVEGNHNYFADGFLVHNCHLALSPSWLRIIQYFHWGAESLSEGWQRPETYTPKCAVVGFTASPDLGTRRNLGELFQGPRPTVNYSFLEAIEEGWLVGITEENIPIKIDTRKFRVKRSAEGDTFSVEDQNAVLIPIIKELAAQIVERASNRKTIAFVPSVEIASLMAEALNSMGLKAFFVSGECIDKNEKTDAFAASGNGTVLVNCCLYTYGVDFQDVNCVAPLGAFISKVKYIQSIYRGTRVLPGVVSDDMTAEERVAAIAASAKPNLLVLSPFFISERHHICEPFDLFGVKPEGSKIRTKPDLTNPKEIRDYIKLLEKEADKHQHRQPRTINPVALSVSLGVQPFVPTNAQEAGPPSREALDLLLAHDVSTVDIKTDGEAQMLVSKLRLRDQLKLASPKALQQLTLRLHWPPEKAATMSAKQAGVLIWKGIRYRRPAEPITACYCNATSHPPCSYCESGAGAETVRDGM